MLAVLNKVKKDSRAEQPKREDIIVTKVEYNILENEDGSETRYRTTRKVNVTKMVNETKKLVKNNQTSEILAKLEEIKGAYTK